MASTESITGTALDFGDEGEGSKLANAHWVSTTKESLIKGKD